MIESGRVGIGDELRERNRALASGTQTVEFGLLSQQNRGPISARVCFRQGAPDGAAIADLYIRNSGCTIMKNRDSGSDGGFLDLSVPGEGSEAQCSVLFLYVGGPRNEVQIHQMAGIRKAQFHERNQALAAGEQLGLVA